MLAYKSPKASQDTESSC